MNMNLYMEDEEKTIIEFRKRLKEEHFDIISSSVFHIYVFWVVNC